MVDSPLILKGDKIMLLSEIEKQYQEVKDMRIQTLDYTEMCNLLREEKSIVSLLSARLDKVCDSLERRGSMI
jgi:hypothetical protein